MPSPFALDAYLDRIGYRGARVPTFATLAAVHALHPAAIPFENLNPLLGWPVALDAKSLERKMIAAGRGGWCFEHNTLFRYALEALGFHVTSLAARVLWNAPRTPSARAATCCCWCRDSAKATSPMLDSAATC